MRGDVFHLALLYLLHDTYAAAPKALSVNLVLYCM